MSAEVVGESQEHEARKARFFVGDITKPPFKDGLRGYFVGFFMRDKNTSCGENLDILGRDDVECAVTELPVRDDSRPHYHKIGYEITFCLSGKLSLIVDSIHRVELMENQFIVILAGTVLQNPQNNPGTRVFVVKVPSIPEDKYYAE